MVHMRNTEGLFLYSEGSQQAVVKIAEDLSDSEWERYRLKMVTPMSPGWEGIGVKAGDTFTVDYRRDYPNILWRLQPYSETTSAVTTAETG